MRFNHLLQLMTFPGKARFEPLHTPISLPSLPRRISIFALISLTVIFALAACEDQTITIEQSTPEPGSTSRVLSSPSDAGTPGPTPTPRPRIDFPPLSDGAALTALFDATGGESWQNSDGWLYQENLGQWHGVTANASGRVTGLDLSGNGLSGELPEELEYLTELTELNLSNNELDESLPAAMGSLANLEELYLNNNQFSGALPAGLASLAALTDLHLHDNRLSGEFPAALAELSELESVTVWNNGFTWAESYPPGPVADMVGLLVVHESLGGENWGSGYQWLTGASVADWGGVTTDIAGRVTELALPEGSLDGKIPSHLGDMTALTRLVMAGNQELDGEIPATFGNLGNLQELDLSRNAIEGEIPAGLANATSLQSLSLNDNRLSGEIPPELGNLASLEILSLNNNGLSGPIPAEIGSLSELNELRLSGNNLSEAVPVEIGKLTSLDTLLLGNNNLSGELPTELGNLSNLEEVTLWGNDFTGADSYADGRFADLVALMVLYDATSPQVNWEEQQGFPNSSYWGGVNEMSTDNRVASLTLSGNMTGTIPPEIGLLTGLYLLRIENQPGLTGPIPSELANLTNLQILELDDNGLTGEIPPQLGNLAKLNKLDLSSNKLSGAVPPELGNLVSLKELYLRDNDLSGEFPDELSNLLNLESIALWGNDFTWADSYSNGRLADLAALMALYEATSPQVNWEEQQGFPNSSYWGGVNEMSTDNRVASLTLSGNMTGTIPPEIGLLTGLYLLRIENQPGLTGPIPSELANLTNLQILELDDNGLTGEIPPQLGNLAKLNKLDLSSNKLSGAVPPELGNLVSLKELYLRDNDLSGEFPDELSNLTNLGGITLWGNDFTWADSYSNGRLADLAALMALYEATSPQVNWEERSNFPTSYNWEGVREMSSGGRVAFLQLKRKNMSGTIPPEIGLLTGLERLWLSDNPGLTGCIPANLRGIDYEGDLPFCE